MPRTISVTLAILALIGATTAQITLPSPPTQAPSPNQGFRANQAALCQQDRVRRHRRVIRHRSRTPAWAAGPRARRAADKGRSISNALHSELHYTDPEERIVGARPQARPENTVSVVHDLG